MKKNTQKVIVDNIPLKVKKNNNQPDTKKDIPILKKDKKPLAIFSNVKIIGSLLLLVISLLLIINIVKELDTKEPAIDITEVEEKIEINKEIGAWLTENKSLFIFEQDNVFHWYDSYDSRNDNYYSGIYTYKSGVDAVKEMGYSKDEFQKTFGENTQMKNAYSITVQVKTSKKNGKDTSEKDLKDNETWWIIIIKTEDGKAICYNKTLDLRYNLTSINI